MGGFADYYGQTSVHPVGLMAILVLSVATLVLPRRYVVGPMIVMACVIPPAQRVVVMGLDFTFLRLLVLFAWTRLLLKNEIRMIVWRRLDTAFVAWLVCATFMFLLQQKTGAALVYRLGFMFEAAGMYFFFRCVIQEWEDVDSVAFIFILVSIPVMLAFTYEWMTRQNPFAMFGGVPEMTQTRQGRLRCQGAFSHPIIAGCFWASALPLMISRWWANPAVRFWTVVGCVAALLIIATTASSTPFMSLVGLVVGSAAFLVRKQMQAVRWTLLAVLICLHVVMKGPVWALIARIDFGLGSTGWQRFNLLDNAIRRFGEWWLVGTRSTAHWGNMLYDINNQYVKEAVQGGLITLIAFIVMLAIAFGGVGRARRTVEDDPRRLPLAWALGVSLFAHVITWFGVSYFGQILMLLYLHLAMIGSMTPSLVAESCGTTHLAETDTEGASKNWAYAR